MKSLVKIGMAITLMFSISAHAGIITPIQVMASSTKKGFDADNLINGSGMKGDDHTNNKKGKWLGVKNELPSLVFDLGEAFSISDTTIWNFGGGNARNAKSILVESSLDGILYKAVAELSLDKAVGSRFGGETFGLDTIARYIRIDIQSNYGARYSGLSEVQFSGKAAPVPEPATLMLMLLGLAGLAIKSRKQLVVVLAEN